MIHKGTPVRATQRWGYGKEIVTGVIDRDYLEEIDSRAALTIWTDSGSFINVTIDARFWDIERK